MTSENGIPVSWNADGNMISDGVNTYSWTYGNRMMGASRSGMTATYDYDSDDRRTKKTVNGVVTRTMWSGADEVGEYNAAGALIRRFIPDGTGGMDARLMTVEAGGTAYWHHTDRQGSVVATSNAAGQVVATATYSPHGEFGTGTTAPPTGSSFGYTGRQYDPETGLYQYRARYYSPRLGVFLSTDPIGTKDDPNLYLYVGADPVNHTDPTGREAQDPITVGAGVGCAVTGPACPVGAPVGALVGGVIAGGVAICASHEPCRDTVADVGRQVWDFLTAPLRSDPVDEVRGRSTEGERTRGRTRNRELPGGIDEANEDFDNVVDPETVRERPGGIRTGQTEDGRNVVVRPDSSDGRPTLEIQDGRRYEKFRYGERKKRD